ncbi:CbtA family protein [Leptospira barantonii]|uniref:Cobalt transporter n=1 Tax=Leptospira barantonii TaxID=2023184 RepID=A0ABX4NKL3_9LEPT|nr:CbtA family protein [Leptospira barantonii]PJZ57358.1 hypothetical protein CH367_11590 [Leptospira barantonii]
MRENLFKRLVLGSKAGLIAGVAYGILLQFLVTPMILKAEVFETNANVSSASANTTTSAKTHSHSHVDGKKHHHHSAVVSNEGSDSSQNIQDENFETLKRNVWTWIGCLLLGLAFGVLSAIGYSSLEFTNILTFEWIESVWKPSLLISGIGFIVFYAIPSLGLPLQLPGVAGSEEDFELRQAWWLQSIFLSSAALTFWFWIRNRFFKGRISSAIAFVFLLGILFAFLFWIPGVPKHSTTTSVPNDLLVEFRIKSAIANFFLWSTIGFLISNSIAKNREVPFPLETRKV